MVKQNSPFPPYTFETSLEWTGEHEGVMRSPDKHDVQVQCPPPFCDVPDNKWTPEHFFAGSVEMCLMMTFLWLAGRAGIEFLSYKSHAMATADVVDKKTMFTKVEVWPTVVAGDARTAKKLKTLLRSAERNCLVSNTVKCDVIFNTEIIVAEEEAEQA